MAAATVTSTEYGYSITGGTDTTTISDTTLRVKALVYCGDDNDNTATLTTTQAGAAVSDTPTTISVYKFKCNNNDDDSSMASYAYFGEEGVPMTGLAVTFSDAADILYIHVR